MPEAEFISNVVDAYEHLYDLVCLRTHPLTDILVPSPSLPVQKQARRLHRTLLDAIGELDPGPQAPAFSHEWRRHRLMVLRYVKGLNPQAVADQLSISLRHYYRVHKAAIKDIASILWNRFSLDQSLPQQTDQPVEQRASLGRMELLRLETARLAQADRFARVSDVVEGVFPLLREMLYRHEVDLQVTIPQSVPDVSIDRNLLRQMLLGILCYLIERATQATVRLVAQTVEAGVILSITVEPPEATRVVQQAEVGDELAGFEEMAALTGAHISPMHAGQSIVGFDLQLPTAERTVLVVDDNEDVLRLYQSFLSPHGYRVITAQTSSDALEKASQFRPYAITLDLMMPEQDGWELIQILLNQPDTCHIPIIVCTVLKQKELALSLGAIGFLEKPVTEQALLSAIEALEGT